jgi:dCMP deaminase
MLINAGIRRIVYEEGYPDPLAGEMITEAGIEVVRMVLEPQSTVEEQ